MGMSTGGKPGGLQTEINVTPLIDVVLVLLIIFLVTMPIMMKMVTLEVPRKLDDANEMPDPAAGNPITVTIKADMSVILNDGEKDTSIALIDLPKNLRPLLDKKISDKVVFVDFDEQVVWNTVVETMDQVRSIAIDANHDEVKVALKVKIEAPAPQ
ncbi:MAG: biopolymer transporter ExbD [Kofleriaceae bacterium]|nr:biopolymer transporter ExbD [Kofleriaceae bacterium]